MLKMYIGVIPQLIILGALVYYLTRKRDVLGMVLSFSFLTVIILGMLQRQQSLAPGNDFTERFRMMTLLGNLSLIAYTVFAIAFLMLIISILKPATQDYQFLDDTKQSSEHLQDPL